MPGLETVAGEGDFGARASGASAHMRYQTALSLTLLAALCLTFAGLAAAARLTPVIDNHVAREETLQRLTDGIFLYDDGYIDDGDYVLVGQLQQDDHTRGGVYFIGSSQTRAAIMPWRLPAAEQALIRNYSIGDLRHRDLRFYLRSLVEEHGLLSAGGENVTIFLELSPAMTRPQDYAATSYVSHVFTRQRFYTYDGELGIHRAPMSFVERWVRLQRVDVYRFLRVLFLARSRVKLFTPEQQSPQAVSFGATWSEALASETAELAATLDYLRERNVRVRAIFPPTGTWIEAQPYEAEYRRVVTPLLAERGIPVVDQSDFLQDYEFGDDWHATYSGQLRLHEADRQLALTALEEMDLAPPR
jgi:hypothetical protein